MPRRYRTDRAMPRMFATQNTRHPVMSRFTNSSTSGSVTILEDQLKYSIRRKSNTSLGLPAGML